jgi:molecular chaperone DnaJ
MATPKKKIASKKKSAPKKVAAKKSVAKKTPAKKIVAPKKAAKAVVAKKSDKKIVAQKPTTPPKPGSKEETCTTCNGNGQVRKMMQTVLGAFQQVVTCDSCHGKGKKYSKNCHVCHGHGRVQEEENITLDIPAGIDTGQALSLQGKGHAGEYGASPGDLIVEVFIKKHARLVRRGEQILSEEKLSFADMALGASVSLETVDGQMTIKIPAGTQPGEVFRIRGKGVPNIHGRGRGDHLVTVSIAVPKKLSKAAKKALEELKKEGV